MAAAEIRSALGLAPSNEARVDHLGVGSVWTPDEGERVGPLRRTMLRLLQPFTDGQRDLDARRARALELLAYETRWLGRRVDSLERDDADESRRS
jgi:hypothetical protein